MRRAKGQVQNSEEHQRFRDIHKEENDSKRSSRIVNSANLLQTGRRKTSIRHSNKEVPGDFDRGLIVEGRGQKSNFCGLQKDWEVSNWKQ